MQQVHHDVQCEEVKCTRKQQNAFRLLLAGTELITTEDRQLVWVRSFLVRAEAFTPIQEEASLTVRTVR